jgi:hypothetical protein
MRILHWRQIDERKEGRLDIRIAREAVEEERESKKSLGAIRARGCMAALLGRWDGRYAGM